MIIARYYRDDLVTGDPDMEIDFSVIWSFTTEGLHEQAVAASKRHVGATAYQLFEGTTFYNLEPISLRYSLK